jgi:hypothetical protein
MGPNEIAVVVLAAVGLILGIIEQAKAQWQSLSDWAIILVAVSILVLAINPLK